MSAIKRILVMFASFAFVSGSHVLAQTQIDCASFIEQEETEIVSNNECSSSATQAERRALRDLSAYLVTLNGFSCKDDECDPDSCDMTVSYGTGAYSLSSYQDPITGCWTGVASVTGKVVYSCSECL